MALVAAIQLLTAPAATVARMIRCLGPALKALGLRTKIQFPEGVNAKTSWRYIRFVGDDRRIWPYIGALSYHLYSTADPYRQRMRDLAVARCIPNGQTEQMGNKLARMYDDLTRGGVSYWSTYGWGGVIEISHDGTSFRRGRYYWPLRQVMHYVRPGAVRVEASCDDESLRALAFVHRGRLTVVLMNDTPPARAQAVTISGLPAGRYGLARTVATGLSVAGKYVFALTAVDRTKATTRDVELTGGAEVGPGPFAGRAGDHPPAGPTLAMMSPWPAVVK